MHTSTLNIIVVNLWARGAAIKAGGPHVRPGDHVRDPARVLAGWLKPSAHGASWDMYIQQKRLIEDRCSSTDGHAVMDELAVTWPGCTQSPGGLHSAAAARGDRQRHPQGMAAGSNAMAKRGMALTAGSMCII